MKSLQEVFMNKNYKKLIKKFIELKIFLGKKKIDGIEYALVKWSGYSDKFNEWIPMADTKKL